MTQEIRERAARMEDFEFVASTGARVKVDCSLLRAMTPHEAKMQREKTERLFRTLCEKYGVRPCG